MGPRAGLCAVEKRKDLALLGLEPGLSGPFLVQVHMKMNVNKQIVSRLM
jgi:hypothetical protein